MPGPPAVQVLTLDGLAATERLGIWLGERAQAGEVITLSGGLGAGKTTLTQAIGLGLEVPGHCYITSPTFALLHEYPGRLPLYHLDLYRLTEPELDELGLADYLYGDGLSVVEWPDRLGGLTPRDRLEIELAIVSEAKRVARLAWHGRLRARMPEGRELASLVSPA